MVSNFKSIVESMAQAKKIEILKSVGEKIWYLDRKLDSGEIKLAQAVSELRAQFRYNFTPDDYRKIEKEVSYNLH